MDQKFSYLSRMIIISSFLMLLLPKLLQFLFYLFNIKKHIKNINSTYNYYKSTWLLAVFALDSSACALLNIDVFDWSRCFGALTGDCVELRCSENAAIFEWSNLLTCSGVSDCDSIWEFCLFKNSVFDWSNCLGMCCGLLTGDWVWGELNIAVLVWSNCRGAGLLVPFLKVSFSSEV